jgi:CBS domain-containing protein
MLSDKITTLELAAPLIVQSGASVSSVVDEIQRHKPSAGCVLIWKGESLAGIMTERDVLLKVVARDVDGKEPVDRFMTPDPITMTTDQTIGDAINLMNQYSFRHIPVVDQKTGQVTSIFSVSDVINYLAESFPDQVINLPPRPHQKIMTPEGA